MSYPLAFRETFFHESILPEDDKKPEKTLQVNCIIPHISVTPQDRQGLFFFGHLFSPFF